MNLKFTLLTAALFFTLGTQAQTAYTISSSSNWSAKLPSTCYNCIISISTGATLTIDNSVTCQNCTFQGGTLSMTNETLNIQYANSATAVATYFNNVNFLVYGKSSSVVVNAPLSLTGSTFTFYSKSGIQTSYDVNLNASVINLFDSSSMQTTGGSSTNITLYNSSRINVGNGSQTSLAYLFINGPTLNVDDKSGVALGNNNNYYFNWSNYNGATAKGSANISYSTSGSTMNCGGSYPHACASPYVYGPATLSSNGVVTGNTLPVVLIGFNAAMNINGTVTLDWNTRIEENSSHFDIERSQDGSNWTTIGTVNAKGNSNSEVDYTFTDENPLTGAGYYRLKMVDLDGHSGYTDVKLVRSTTSATISFFPNPARDYVNVNLPASSATSTTIRLISLAGQIMQEKKVEGGNTTIVTFPLQQLTSGMYILTVAATDGTHLSSKVLVTRN